MIKMGVQDKEFVDFSFVDMKFFKYASKYLIGTVEKFFLMYDNGSRHFEQITETLNSAGPMMAMIFERLVTKCGKPTARINDVDTTS